MNKNVESGEWSSHWALASKHGLTTDRVDAKCYTSAEVFAEEKRKIFAKQWIAIGRTAELPDPGDYIRRDFFPLEVEVIVARARDGALNAFINACLHRGAALVSNCGGNTSAFVCPYHAWSYALDGTLKGVPGRNHFPQLAGQNARLKPVHVDVWNGFVFLNFADKPEQTLIEYLGGFAELFRDAPFEDYPHVVELTRDINANWKTAVEASNEAYHVSVLHRQSTSPQVSTVENPLNNRFDPIFSRPHASATTGANKDWRPQKPVMKFVYSVESFRAQPGGTQVEARKAGARRFIDHHAVNRIDLPSMATEAMLLFPFTCVQLMNNRYIWFQYWPVSVDKTRLVFRMYSERKPFSYREVFAESHMIAYSRDVVTEDCNVIDMQHRGLKGGGLSEVIFGDNECLLRHFHEMIAKYLADVDEL